MSNPRLMDFLKTQQFKSIEYRFRTTYNQGPYYYQNKSLYVLAHETAVTIKDSIERLQISHHEVMHRDDKQNNALHFILSGKLYELPSEQHFDTFYYGPTKYCVLMGTTSSPSLNKTSYLPYTHDLIETAANFANRQNEQLPIIIKAVLAPFKVKSEAFTHLMLAKNKEGDTPLHIAIKKRTLQDIKPLLEKISTLSLSEKKQIASAGNHHYTNTFGYALQQCDDKCVSTYISHFKDEALFEAVFSPDKNGYTGFHYACSSNIGDPADKVKQLIALEKKENKATLIKSISSLTTTGQNALHLACQTDKSDEADLVQTIRNIFIKTNQEEKSSPQWKNLIARQDSRGYTPLHYACLSGNAKSVEYLLKDLPFESKSELINITNQKGETPLDIACQCGNRAMLSHLLESFSLEDAYNYQTKFLQTKHLKLIHKNTNLVETEFKELLNKNTSPLIECYRYLVIRSKKSGFLHPEKDYEARLAHFISCITLKFQASEEDLPLPKHSFFQGKTQQYQEKTQGLDKVTPQEAKDFVTFLQGEKDKTSVAKRILDALHQQPTNQLSITPSAPFI
jgi:ankyrin repeat protein